MSVSAFNVQFEFDDVGRIIRLTIDGDNITARTLQQIKFRRIHRNPRPPVDEALLELNLQRLQTERPIRGRGKTISEPFFRLVADTYEMCQSDFPIKEISDRTGINTNTVSGWVHKARARGIMAQYERHE